MTILVWGAGAIGGTLGAALIRAGEDVLFIDRDADHVAAINAKGLTITGPIAPHHVEAKAVLPDAVTGSFDRVLLCVKAHMTDEATRQLAPYLAPDGYVVSMQNGLNEDVIAAVIGRERTIGAFVNFGADYIEPGVVLHGGRAAVVVGELDGRQTERIVALHRLLLTFEPRAVLTDNIYGFLWGKLVYGALLFATAMTDDSIADVFAIERFRPALARLGQEVVRVAQAEGVRMEAFDGFDPAAFRPGAPPSEAAQSFDDMVAHNRRSAKSHSGIWRDLAVRKRKTEADAQIGPIVTIGARHGVPTPLTSFVVDRIHALEEGRATMSLDALEGLDAVARQGVLP